MQSQRLKRNRVITFSELIIDLNNEYVGKIIKMLSE